MRNYCASFSLAGGVALALFGLMSGRPAIAQSGASQAPVELERLFYDDFDCCISGDDSQRCLALQMVYNTAGLGVLGCEFPAGIVAFWTAEARVGADLDGDGNIDDIVVRYYDLFTGAIMNTGAKGTSRFRTLAVSGDVIAFHRRESLSDGEDLNGDGDSNDTVLFVYNTSTGNLTNTQVTIASEGVDVDESLVVFTTPAVELGVYDVFTGETLFTGVVGFRPQISGRTIAMTGPSGIRYHTLGDVGTPAETVDIGVNATMGGIDGDTILVNMKENALGEDKDGDGSLTDFVILHYDIGSRTLADTGVLGRMVTSISGDILTFSTVERELGPFPGEDLNGDGDTADTIVRYFDIATAVTTNTGVDHFGGNSGTSIDGDIIVFVTQESSVGRRGEDLNGDGDIDDFIVRYLDLSKGITFSTGADGFAPVVSLTE